MIWHIGNTTVRNPSRIRDGLIAYEKYGEVEDLHGKSRTDLQMELFNALKQEDVIDSKETDDKDKQFFARKWRLSFTEMGLISMKTDEYFSGQITKTGWALISSESDAEIQDIFLRILYNYEYRKKGYQSKIGAPFRPLIFIVNILKELERIVGDSRISLDEYSLFIQDFNPEKLVNDYVNNILKFREELITHKGEIKKFLTKKYAEIAKLNGVKPATIRGDYPDVSIRLLKLSGLFISKGRGIMLNPQFETLIDNLSSDYLETLGDEYYSTISNFPPLPIDSERDVLVEVLRRNSSRIKSKSNSYIEPNYDLPTEELARERVKQDDILSKQREIEYAHQQRFENDNISNWINFLMAGGKSMKELDEDMIGFNQRERPQYLEWIVWRSFLSINCIKSPPYESRGFRIDVDFKPIHHAPAGNADLVFEFEDFILVVEVTFSSSSTQFAMEGEPVLRHVYKTQVQHNKPTYGLFIAPSIETNLAYLFLNNREWWKKDGSSKTDIYVVPVSIESFTTFFNRIPKAHKDNPSILKSIIESCIKLEEKNPVKWIGMVENKFKDLKC